MISIGRERYSVGETLFQPSILGLDEDGLADQLLRSVSMCYPSENQRQLFENIVLCGGTSMMTGMSSNFTGGMNVGDLAKSEYSQHSIVVRYLTAAYFVIFS